MIVLSVSQIHFSEEEIASAIVKDYMLQVEQTTESLTVKVSGPYEISENGTLFSKELTLRSNRFGKIKANIRVKVQPISSPQKATISHHLGQETAMLNVLLGTSATPSPTAEIFKHNLKLPRTAPQQKVIKGIPINDASIKRWAFQTPSPVFGISDDTQIFFDNQASASSQTFVRFAPAEFGKYTALLIGYDAQNKAVAEVSVSASSQKTLPIKWIAAGTVVLALLGVLGYLYHKPAGDNEMSGYALDFAPTANDTIVVGFSDQLLLKDQDRVKTDFFTAFPHAAIDVYSYDTQPIGRLYELARQKKVHFIVALKTEADTNALLWSAPYTAEDGQIGILRTTNNQQWIQKLNQVIAPTSTSQQP